MALASSTASVRPRTISSPSAAEPPVRGARTPIFETLPAAIPPLAAQIATAPIRAPNSVRLVVANSPSLWRGRGPLVQNRHVLQDRPIDARMSNRSHDRPVFA